MAGYQTEYRAPVIRPDIRISSSTLLWKWTVPRWISSLGRPIVRKSTSAVAIDYVLKFLAWLWNQGLEAVYLMRLNIQYFLFLFILLKCIVNSKVNAIIFALLYFNFIVSSILFAIILFEFSLLFLLLVFTILILIIFIVFLAWLVLFVKNDVIFWIELTQSIGGHFIALLSLGHTELTALIFVVFLDVMYAKGYNLMPFLNLLAFLLLLFYLFFLFFFLLSYCVLS